MVTITLTGCVCAPRWEGLEMALKESLDAPRGYLTRISRDDGGCDYRALGTYTLEFTTPTETTTVKVSVS